jgi:hypothetical protein
MRITRGKNISRISGEEKEEETGLQCGKRKQMKKQVKARNDIDGELSLFRQVQVR